MQATQQDIEKLEQLQQVDIIGGNSKRELDALPQRAQLQQLAQKKQAILAKQEQVVKMHDTASRALMQIDNEREILHKRQADTQTRIDEAAGDYRSISSLTKDMDGMAKRLDKLEHDREESSAKLNQITGMNNQISDAVSALDKKAESLAVSFRKSSDHLMAEVNEAKKRHDALAAGVPAELLKKYQRTLNLCGGVALCELQDNQCSACRSTLEMNRMLALKRQAPLAECPQCHRLMIIR